MREPPSGDWCHLSTEVTDKNGKITYTIPSEKSLGLGVFPIKMIVRGDHTFVDFLIAVVPPQTPAIVFSIDGSFAASMSVTGKDPKVRPGAVDVCRYWQDLGYLLIYVTGRPDMQQHKVLQWLTQHNFPHGIVSFADGLSTDPLGHKKSYLLGLVETQIVQISYAYGSSKDITVYTALGLEPRQMFIVGKVSKKLQTAATALTEGYVAHLTYLKTHGIKKPVQGNSRMVISKRQFDFSIATIRQHGRSRPSMDLSGPSNYGTE